MKKVAFHVEKGGTGKTTMTGNIGNEISRYAKTVLVDGDPQSNLSSWYLTDGVEYELADFFIENVSVESVALPVRDNLSLVPSIAIDGNLKDWSEKALYDLPFAFHDLSDALEQQGYEFALFDLSPGMSNLEKRILAICDEVIPVVAAEYFSVNGVEIFENELEKIKKNYRADFVFNKLVINRVNNAYALHKGYTEALKQRGYEPYIIGQSTDISDCLPEHLSVLEYAPKNKYIGEFKRLAEDIMKE
jgi:cellulose biosynthesis protein BcsQ